MLIRMLTIAAGPEWSAQPGDVVDRPDKEAKGLIAGGYAEPAKDTETKA